MSEVEEHASELRVPVCQSVVCPGLQLHEGLRLELPTGLRNAEQHVLCLYDTCVRPERERDAVAVLTPIDWGMDKLQLNHAVLDGEVAAAGNRGLLVVDVPDHVAHRVVLGRQQSLSWCRLPEHAVRGGKVEERDTTLDLS